MTEKRSKQINKRESTQERDRKSERQRDREIIERQREKEST